MAEKLFNVGVKGVIVRDGKVLIVKGDKGRDFWEVPGGRIDANETIEQALRRELREELPNIQSIILHDVVSAYRVPHDIKENVSLVLVFYKVTADFEGEPVLSNEHIAYQWATEDEALELVNDSCKVAIREVFKQP